MDDNALRQQLARFLDGRDAHMPFDAAVADFPDDAINAKAPNVTYTPWHLAEHVRYTQADILEYITSRTYKDKDWPREYWPDPDATATPAQFAATIQGFKDDRDALKAIVLDPATDLYAVIPGSPGHTILREIRVVGDHNAYHTGEFAILRQIMGTWPADRSSR